MASVSCLASQGLEMEGWKHVRSPLSISSTQSCNSSYSAEDAPHAPVVCDKAALCEKEPLARSQPTVPRSAPGLGLDIGAAARTKLLTHPVLRLFCEGRELGTTCLLSQQLLSRHRNDPESVTGMQTTAGGGESGGGGPQYPHHVPMDLHVPQHFPYYAG